MLDALADVEAREGGIIERSTIHLLNSFGTLEWVGMLSVVRHDTHFFRALHIKGEQVLAFDHFQSGEMGRWFDEMRDRAFLPRVRNRQERLPGETFRIVPVTTVEGNTIVLTGPLSDEQVERLAEEIVEAHHHRAIVTFFQEVWGNVENIARIFFHTIASFGEEAISSCLAFDRHGQPLLPDLDLPFWREHLTAEISPLKRELAACESDDARLEELNAFLFHGSYFKDHGLPDPKSEHPVFQNALHLHSLPVTYPTLYEQGE